MSQKKQINVYLGETPGSNKGARDWELGFTKQEATRFLRNTCPNIRVVTKGPADYVVLANNRNAYASSDQIFAWGNSNPEMIDFETFLMKTKGVNRSKCSKKSRKTTKKKTTTKKQASTKKKGSTKKKTASKKKTSKKKTTKKKTAGKKKTTKKMTCAGGVCSFKK